MTCYITYSHKPTECEGCGGQLNEGFIGLTDEIHGPFHHPLSPQCVICLKSLDEELGSFWASGERQVTRSIGNLAAAICADALEHCEGRSSCGLRERLLQAPQKEN